MASNFAGAIAPPPGVNPNFSNPISLYPDILATVVVFASLTTIFTFARITAKMSFSPLTLEDYVLLLAWATNVAYDFLFLVQGMAGMGRHLWDVRRTESARIAQLSWAIELLYGPAIWLPKMAILLQLTRIFTPSKSGPVYRTIQVLRWGNTAFYFSILFTLIFECVPQEKIWNPLHKGGHCLNNSALILFSSSLNVLSDILILVLPIWATYHLHIAPKQKAGIAAIFATGLIAVTSSICRLAYSIRSLFTADSSYIFAKVGMWTVAEIGSIILCTCFPMMPRFMQLIWNRVPISKASSSRPAGGASKISYNRSKTCRGDGSTLQYSHGTYGGIAWAKGGDETTRLKDAYLPLEGEAWRETRGAGRQTEQEGILQTVSIELTSRDRSHAERGVMSVV